MCGYAHLRPSIRDLFGLRNRRWHPSVVTLLLNMTPKWPRRLRLKLGQNKPKQTQKRPKTVPKSLPTVSDPPSMTNDVPMERFGPWETQNRAYHGPFWVGLSRFAQPKPYFGLLCAKSVTWPYLGLRGSNPNSQGTCPRYKPHFLWFPPLVLSCPVCLVVHIHLCARVPALQHNGQVILSSRRTLGLTQKVSPTLISLRKLLLCEL